MNKETRQFTWGIILLIIAIPFLVNTYNGGIVEGVWLWIGKLLLGGYLSFRGISLIEKTL